MKIKQIIYLLLIVIGTLIMVFGPNYMLKEYSLAIGIVFLMFGIYSVTTTYGNKNSEEADIEE
jgi:disulfide bond formation protein DsbB